MLDNDGWDIPTQEEMDGFDKIFQESEVIKKSLDEPIVNYFNEEDYETVERNSIIWTVIGEVNNYSYAVLYNEEFGREVWAWWSEVFEDK